MNVVKKRKTVVLMTGPSLDGKSGGIKTHAATFIDAFLISNSVDIQYFPVTEGLHNNEIWRKKVSRFISRLIPYGKAVRTSDLIHLNSTFDNRSVIRDCLYLLIAKLFFRKGVVLQFHGGSPSRLSVAKIKLIRKFIGAVFGYSDRVLLLSKIQGGVFETMFPLVKYSIVPNYINCKNFTPARKANSNAEPIIFLFISRIHEEKGVKEIIQASRILFSKGFVFKVLIYGDGPLKEWLVNTLDNSEIRKCVVYGGAVYGEEKIALIRQADIMLLPSYAEGFPYTLLEAFASGVPLIATPVGAVSDVIVPNQTGLLVRPKDSEDLANQMEYAILNRDALHVMGACARKLAEQQFSTEILKQSFETIYEVIGRA